jgi:plastocyanin
VTPTPNPNHIVTVGPGMSFSETITTIPVGTTVEWQWSGALQHSTTSGTCTISNCTPDFLWDSGLHFAPFNFTRTFNTVGTFSYFCTLHGVAGMQGVVNVVPLPARPNVAPAPARATRR